MLLQLVGKLVM